MKIVAFAIASIFMVAVFLAEANCGENWVDNTMAAIGSWVLKGWRK